MLVEKCPECGLRYCPAYAPDKSYHRRVHDTAVNGPKTKLADGSYTVTHQSAIAIQKLAAEAASAARSDAGYDFTSFEAVKKRFDKHNTVAVIRVLAGRVVGLIVSEERKCAWRVELSSFEPDHLGFWYPVEADKVEESKRRTVGMIWVLKTKRRQGVAKCLITGLAEQCGIKIEDIAHLIPFTQDAVTLWTSLQLSPIYVVRG